MKNNKKNTNCKITDLTRKNAKHLFYMKQVSNQDVNGTLNEKFRIFIYGLHELS